MNQAKVLRKLTGEDRLEQAFMLSEFVRELAISDIKERLGPRAAKKNIAMALWQRLHPYKNPADRIGLEVPESLGKKIGGDGIFGRS